MSEEKNKSESLFLFVLEMFLDYELEEVLIGLKVQPMSVTICKDDQILIGISIGGGAPHCPCLYVVQDFDNTPAAKAGTLESGDEILSTQSQSVKSKSKQEVAKIIQSVRGDANIRFNKLLCPDLNERKSIDLLMKKLKHRMVEGMSSQTADALGLSRVLLCNDTIIKKCLKSSIKLHQCIKAYWTIPKYCCEVIFN